MPSDLSQVAQPTKHKASVSFLAFNLTTKAHPNVSLLSEKKDVAEARHDASKAGATVAGHSVSASGVTPNDPNRQQGSWNQTIGSGKEFVGGALGLEGLKKEGQQQNEEGKAQEAAGQLNDLGSGVANRVAGTVGGAVAGLTGNREEQARRADQHDQGKTLQRGVESELQKQADAERK